MVIVLSRMMRGKEYRMYYFFSPEIKGVVSVGTNLPFLFLTTGATIHKIEANLSTHSLMLMSNP